MRTTICSVQENHRTFLIARPKCLMRDFTNLNRIYKAHRTNVWWIMNFSGTLYMGYLTLWGLNKMADILQTTFSNAFSWIKMHEFSLELFVPQCSISQHCFRYCVTCGTVGPGGVSQSLYCIPTIVSGSTGLVLNRWQAITWNNVDKVSWHYMGTPGHNEHFHHFENWRA